MDAFKYPLSSGHVSANGDYPCTDLAVPIMRYAEVILIKAEALLMSGGNADQEINMIRTRAGLAPKTGCTMLDLKQKDVVNWQASGQTVTETLYVGGCSGYLCKTFTWDQRTGGMGCQKF